MLKVGIAGYGVVGKRRRKCVEDHNELQLVAICDQAFNQVGVSEGGIRHYSDYRDLLEDDLDVLKENLLTVFNADIIDVIPQCTYGHLKGEYLLGEICPSCNTKVINHFFATPYPKLWVKTFNTNLPRFISPSFWLSICV